MRKRRFDADEGSFLRFRVSQPAPATNEGDHRASRRNVVALPECKTCALAGETCSFPENDPSAATSKEITELRQQVQGLSQCVEGLKPQLQSKFEDSLQASDKAPQQPPNIGQQTPRGNISVFSHGSVPSTETRTHQTILSPPQYILEDFQVQRYIVAYFSYVHKASPFLNKFRAMEEVDAWMRSPEPREGIPTKLYMLAAIGCAALNHAGRVPDEVTERISVPYHDIICRCLDTTELESVEILLLLALYSVYDPNGMSPWVLTGILGRQAITLGLNRRCRSGSGTTLLETERRYRLFWSSFEIDRVIASVYGLPVAINDENINLPLPGVTVEEYADTEQDYYTQILQISRSIVAFRELEGRVLQKIHLCNASAVANLSHRDRRAIVDDFRSQIDDCPSQFNSSLSNPQLLDLRRSIRQYVNCSTVQLRQGKLSLNKVTVNRLLVICVILVFCHDQIGLDSDAPGEITLCVEILAAFPQRWVMAKRSLAIYRRLQASLLSRSRQFPSAMAGYHLGSISNGKSQSASGAVEALEWVRQDALAIMREALGPPSAYTSYLEQIMAHDTDYAPLTGLDWDTRTAPHGESQVPAGHLVPSPQSSSTDIAFGLDSL
ncbi:fungal-specific transcription factor domain-containing protein [Aspergillus germanicus]